MEHFTSEKIDWLVRAVDFLLKQQALQEKQMSALTDAFNARIDEVIAKLNDCINKDGVIATLQTDLATVTAERDEANASMQAALDRLNAIDTTIR